MIVHGVMKVHGLGAKLGGKLPSLSRHDRYPTSKHDGFRWIEFLKIVKALWSGSRVSRVEHVSLSI